MMISARISFFDNDIKDVNVMLPYPPRVGENIVLPDGVVEYNNGVKCDIRTIKIQAVEWVFTENAPMMVPNFKFRKLIIYVIVV